MTRLRAIVIVASTLLGHCGIGHAQSGLHLVASLGDTDATVDLGGMNRVGDDDSSFAIGIGYSFAERVFLEAAYHDFGGHDGQTNCPPDFACLIVPLQTQADLSGISLSVVRTIELTDSLDFYGKLGLMSWDIEFDDISAAFDDSGTDLHYGLGLSFRASESWSIFAEYESVDLDLDSVSLGVRLGF